MAITKTIGPTGDYVADNTGATSATTAFYTDLKTAMAGQDCNLTVQAGTYKFDTSPGTWWATGMTSLNATMTGVTLTTGTSGGPVLGERNFQTATLSSVSGKSARIRSVSAGSTTVQLTAASAAAGYISRATVGQWMLVAGYDLQGLFGSVYGFPLNFHFLDFVQITAVGTDTITFTPALQNFYSDQWPCFNSESASDDPGGPATVYFLHPDFGGVSTFTDGTYTNNNLIKCEGVNFTMNGGASTDFPIYPSMNKTWTAINHDASISALVEVDKLVETANFQGGSYTQIHTQSSSVLNMNLSGVTTSAALNGTARNTTVDNCTIGGALIMGPTSNGRADTFVARDTTFSGGITSNSGIIVQNFSGDSFHNMASMANGVITIPMCYGADSMFKLFVPDPWGRNVLFWRGTNGSIGGFKVLSVTSDTWPAADNQSATTNVTTTNGLKTVEVSTGLFTAADVGKVIIIPGAGSPSTLRTWITAVTDSTHITVYNAASASLSASSRTIQWGTANVYVHTDQAAGFPSSSLYTNLGIQVPPARSVYFENCTGSADILDLCQAGAQNRPLWSYTNRTWDGVTGFSSSLSPSAMMHGRITSYKVNVTTPYTGAGTLTAGVGFDNVPVIQGDMYTGSSVNFNPRINLKIAGERIITPGSATVGAQSGDTNMTWNSQLWIGRVFSAGMSRDISAESSSLWPSFTVEMITDQGFSTGPTAVVPLCLRLRAA